MSMLAVTELLVAPGGIMAWRLAEGEDVPVEMDAGWSWARYDRVGPAAPGGEPGPADETARENLLVARRNPAVPWHETLDGFVRTASSSAVVP